MSPAKTSRKRTRIIALIPARSGSRRVKHKNVRLLKGHPLIAYTISVARDSDVFDRVIVSTDSSETQKIALHYGAEAPFLRPKRYATSTSPDIEWIKHLLSRLDGHYDAFSILRPTSPFRSVKTVRRAYRKFMSTPDVDSLRAVELCKQHPGKMWVLRNGTMEPLLDQSHLEVTWYAGQYQALPKVYVQNSSLEMAWTRVVWTTGSREGRTLAPFLTRGLEGFSIDYEEDWNLMNQYVEREDAVLPAVRSEPWSAD